MLESLNRMTLQVVRIELRRKSGYDGIDMRRAGCCDGLQGWLRWLSFANRTSLAPARRPVDECECRGVRTLGRAAARAITTRQADCGERRQR